MIMPSAYCTPEDKAIVRSRTTIEGPQKGSVVAVRPVLRGLQDWDHAPRRMAVIALDVGKWCFAWIAEGYPRVGARVQFIQSKAGESYPTCSLIPLRNKPLDSRRPR